MNSKRMSEARKAKGADTRDLIVEKAILVLAKKGYEQTSFQEIADLCGLSQALPVYHFKSKEGLFRAVIDTVKKNKANIVHHDRELSDDAFVRLLKHFRGHISWAQIYRYEAGAFLLFHHFASLNPNFATLYEETLAAERREIEVIIAAGQREKLFRSNQPTSFLAELLHDAILGMITNLLAGRRISSAPKQLEKKSKFIVQTVLNYEKDGK